MGEGEMGDHQSDLFNHPRYPRSSAYDLDWVIANQMGPNPLWLIEELTRHLEIEPGMSVLDLGCGTAITSVFLAREFGAQVWATDLWVTASANLRRIEDAGVADLVFPIHAEAHALPFADGFFDAIVSVDAYHYFGTDDTYLGYITRFLRDRGKIGMVSPSLFTEFGERIPAHLEPFRGLPFHSPDWWSNHWTKTGAVRVDHAEAIPDGWMDWLQWLELTKPYLTEGSAIQANAQETALLQADEGGNVGFVCIVAARRNGDV
jgi:cyclopropane fatty-acyl-phospholipid synthase-like methyltransferase